MEKGDFDALLDKLSRESRGQRGATQTIQESRQRDRDLINPPIRSREDKYFLNNSIIEKKLEINNFKKYDTKILNLQKNYIEKKIDLPSLLPNINKYPQKPIQIQYNPNYANFNFNALPQAGITVDTKTRITADNIAEFAYPLAQFVEQVRPDYIVACDRGARMIALAVHMLYGRLYGALPTQDHSIHFRKISRKVPTAVVREALRPDVERMLATTESPTVLVLDDWVATGGTKSLTQELFAELSGGRVNLLYGVMRGGQADVSGSKDSFALGDWHDRPDLIGVDYDMGSSEPHKVDSKAALAYRQRMSAGIEKFVAGLQPQK